MKRVLSKINSVKKSHTSIIFPYINNIFNSSRKYHSANINTIYNEIRALRRISLNPLDGFKSKKGLILDWSGTLIDPLVFAPAIVFVDLFFKFGVPITIQQARKPMGLRKDLHIKAITEIPEVTKRWINVYGKKPDDNIIMDMFKDFKAKQIEVLRNPAYVHPLPGVINALKKLKQTYNMRFGLTTGFDEDMHNTIMDTLKHTELPKLLDCAVPIKNNIRGRPYSDAVLENCKLLELKPEEVMKIDDTQLGIEEGNNAKVDTIGLVKYSNFMGTLTDNIDEIEKNDLKKYIDFLGKTFRHLEEAKPDYLATTMTDVIDIIDWIDFCSID